MKYKLTVKLEENDKILLDHQNTHTSKLATIDDMGNLHLEVMKILKIYKGCMLVKKQ